MRLPEFSSCWREGPPACSKQFSLGKEVVNTEAHFSLSLAASVADALEPYRRFSSTCPSPLDARPGSPSSLACVPNTTQRTQHSTISNIGPGPTDYQLHQPTAQTSDGHFAIDLLRVWSQMCLPVVCTKPRSGDQQIRICEKRKNFRGVST
jgi:hypothetical protein